MASGRKYLGPNPSVDNHLATKEYSDDNPPSADREFMLLKDIKIYTSNGGSSTADTWMTRTLNTTDHNDISGASLSSNRFTLPAGTYVLRATAPGYKTSHAQLRLYNYTDSSVVGYGCTAWNNNEYIQLRSELICVFTITSSKAFEIQHIVDSSQATYGLGCSSEGLISGYVENGVFTMVLIEKIG